MVFDMTKRLESKVVIKNPFYKEECKEKRRLTILQELKKHQQQQQRLARQLGKNQQVKVKNDENLQSPLSEQTPSETPKFMEKVFVKSGQVKKIFVYYEPRNIPGQQQQRAIQLGKNQQVKEKDEEKLQYPLSEQTPSETPKFMEKVFVKNGQVKKIFVYYAPRNLPAQQQQRATLLEKNQQVKEKYEEKLQGKQNVQTRQFRKRTQEFISKERIRQGSSKTRGRQLGQGIQEPFPKERIKQGSSKTRGKQNVPARQFRKRIQGSISKERIKQGSSKTREKQNVQARQLRKRIQEPIPKERFKQGYSKTREKQNVQARQLRQRSQEPIPKERIKQGYSKTREKQNVQANQLRKRIQELIPKERIKRGSSKTREKQNVQARQLRRRSQEPIPKERIKQGSSKTRGKQNVQDKLQKKIIEESKEKEKVPKIRKKEKKLEIQRKGQFVNQKEVVEIKPKPEKKDLLQNTRKNKETKKARTSQTPQKKFKTFEVDEKLKDNENRRAAEERTIDDYLFDHPTVDKMEIDKKKEEEKKEEKEDENDLEKAKMAEFEQRLKDHEELLKLEEEEEAEKAAFAERLARIRAKKLKDESKLSITKRKKAKKNRSKQNITESRETFLEVEYDTQKFQSRLENAQAEDIQKKEENQRKAERELFIENYISVKTPEKGKPTEIPQKPSFNQQKKELPVKRSFNQKKGKIRSKQSLNRLNQWEENDKARRASLAQKMAEIRTTTIFDNMYVKGQEAYKSKSKLQLIEALLGIKEGKHIESKIPTKIQKEEVTLTGQKSRGELVEKKGVEFGRSVQEKFISDIDLYTETSFGPQTVLDTGFDLPRVSLTWYGDPKSLSERIRLRTKYLRRLRRLERLNALKNEREMLGLINSFDSKKSTKKKLKSIKRKRRNVNSKKVRYPSKASKFVDVRAPISVDSMSSAKRRRYGRKSSGDAMDTMDTMDTMDRRNTTSIISMDDSELSQSNSFMKSESETFKKKAKQLDDLLHRPVMLEDDITEFHEPIEQRSSVKLLSDIKTRVLNKLALNFVHTNKLPRKSDDTLKKALEAEVQKFKEVLKCEVKTVTEDGTVVTNYIQEPPNETSFIMDLNYFLVRKSYLGSTDNMKLEKLINEFRMKREDLQHLIMASKTFPLTTKTLIERRASLLSWWNSIENMDSKYPVQPLESVQNMETIATQQQISIEKEKMREKLRQRLEEERLSSFQRKPSTLQADDSFVISAKSIIQKYWPLFSSKPEDASSEDIKKEEPLPSPECLKALAQLQKLNKGKLNVRKEFAKIDQDQKKKKCDCKNMTLYEYSTRMWERYI